MESTFGKIKSKKFVGFNGWFGWKEKVVGSNNLEKDEKND